MKILSIGNSYSEDAHRYIHRAAKTNGLFIETLNLYIGGCSLERHYENFISDRPEYEAQINGENTERKISIREALTLEEWDAVTLQQASPLSFIPESYFPYIEVLRDAVSTLCPHAALYLHETWGYKENSERLKKLGFESHEAMYRAAETTYVKTAKKIGVSGIIPSGKAVSLLYRDVPAIDLFRDDIHMSLSTGRFLLALVWISYFTDILPEEIVFSEFDRAFSENRRGDLNRAAKEACLWSAQFRSK